MRPTRYQLRYSRLSGSLLLSVTRCLLKRRVPGADGRHAVWRARNCCRRSCCAKPRVAGSAVLLTEARGGQARPPRPKPAMAASRTGPPQEGKAQWDRRRLRRPCLHAHGCSGTASHHVVPSRYSGTGPGTHAPPAPITHHAQAMRRPKSRYPCWLPLRFQHAAPTPCCGPGRRTYIRCPRAQGAPRPRHFLSPSLRPWHAAPKPCSGPGAMYLYPPPLRIDAGPPV